MGVAGPLVLFSGVFLWCVFNTKHVLPPMTDLNSLQIDDESDPIKLDLEVKNMHNVHHEDITKLAYKPEVYNKVVEYLKPHVPNITEQDISISITPTEEVEVPRFSEYYEVEIKVVGCNIDTSNRLIPGSYIVIRGIVNVHDVLFDITDNLVIEEMNPFVLSKVKDNPEFLPTIDGDYGQIINDYSFRQSILRQMKTINPKITKDDFEISIAEQFETLAENSYEIYVNITATTSSTLIKGSISFPYQVNIEVINVVVVSIGNITLANQTADILVDSVNSVTTIETDAVNNNYELQQVVLKEMRKTSPYVLLSDFTLSNDVAHELYSNQVLEQTCTVTVTATDSSFVIKDSFTFTLNLKIHEQTIHATYNGKYNVGYNLGNSETFNVQGHASVKVTITTIDINFT
jgi:preprotein translocase subunit SecB